MRESKNSPYYVGGYWSQEGTAPDKNGRKIKKPLFTIVSYLKEWSSFRQKAIAKQMTEFKVLSNDRLVQSTEFGTNLKVIANFSDKDFIYNNETI